jgi:hypothetical protein
MTVIINGTGGVTYPDSTTQASANISAANITSGTLSVARLPAGAVLQVVQSVKTDTFSGTANTSEISVTGISATITPSSSSSKILILAHIMYSSVLTTYGGYFKRNSTAIGLGAAGSGQQLVSMGMAFVTDGNQTNTFIYSYLDSPATTSSTTYQFFVNNDNNVAIFFNRSATDQSNATGKRGISTVTLMEIAA